MSKIIRLSSISKILQKLTGKKIVVVGGCFDVLHPGHIIFLQKAKKAGDILIVLLESDEKIKKIKGVNRPVHNQHERSLVLSAIAYVDYIIELPDLKNDEGYDRILLKINPHIIAATEGIDDFYHKRTANLSGAKLKYVTKIIGEYSTSKIIRSNVE